MKKWLFISAVVWFFAVGIGLSRLWAYTSTPGPVGEVPVIFPADTAVSSQSGRPTLVMFVHPRCPCSRASLSELKKIMEHTRGHAVASVMFMRPMGTEDRWEQTEYWELAKAIPGVTVHVDTDGVEADRFGAQTSGDVVLFDAQGRLLFRGGITASRGHVGDNAGQLAVTDLIRGSTSTSEDSPVQVTREVAHVEHDPDHPVYGCSFHTLQPSAPN